MKQVNSTRRQHKIREALEDLGHTGVAVWWEPVGPALEMCGYSGGFFFTSTQSPRPEPIGLSMREALQIVAARFQRVGGPAAVIGDEAR